MKFSEVMIYFDYNMTNIARALQIKRQCITPWRRKNKIPWARQCELEILTEGKLKANRDE